MTLSGDFMLLRPCIVYKVLLNLKKRYNHINEKITCCYGANAYDERSHASASKS